MEEMMGTLGILFFSTLRMSTPIALAGLGGVFSARVGIMALGLEGFLLMGAWGSAYGSFLTNNAFLGLLIGTTISVLYALLFGLLCIKYHTNQVICGIGFNLFSLGFTTTMTQIVWGSRSNSVAVKTLPRISVGNYNLSILTLVLFVAAIVSWYVLFKTPVGLRLRVVGESAMAANTMGIAVNRYKFIGIGIAGAFCGVGGAFLSIDHVNMFVRDMTSGRGYIAVAVNILGRYSPFGVLSSGFLFGLADSLQLVIPSDTIPSNLMKMIPYLVTLIVMVVAVKYVRAPAGIGEVLD